MSNSKKVKVFVSSRCGKGAEGYNKARVSIKEKLENLSFFEVWLFEESSATTFPSETQFLCELKDSHVCVFIIDNAEGVSAAVQKEVDHAKKHGVKSLFYFCAEQSTELTSLQRSLIGGRHPHVSTINSLDELCERGVHDILNDILFIYQQYCTGYLYFPEEAEEYSPGKFEKDAFLSSYVIGKNVLGNIDECKNAIHHFVLNRELEITSTNDLDKQCSYFLLSMLNMPSSLPFDDYVFLSELASIHEDDLLSVVKKRWVAIQAYFHGDVDVCVEKLEDVLQLARTLKLPSWFIEDILIDLRNQQILQADIKSTLLYQGSAQKELDNCEHIVSYPLLDRFDGNEYESYIESAIKEKIKSPFSITYGNSFGNHVGNIASSFIVAMVNGSLTQILKTYDRLEHFAFYLCEKYSDSFLRTTFMKLVVVNRKTSDTKGLLRSMDSISRTMDSESAKTIFDFTERWPIVHQRKMYALKAFCVVGYYLSEEDFDEISAQIIDDIGEWMKTESRYISLGDNIVSMLNSVNLRLDDSTLLDICILFFENNLRRWYDDVVQFVAEEIDFADIEADRIDIFLSLVGGADEKSCRADLLKSLILTLRYQGVVGIEKLHQVTQDRLKDFYAEEYLVYTEEGSSKDRNEFAKKHIGIVESRNCTQGVNRMFTRQGINSYYLLGRLVRGYEEEIESDLVHLAFDTAYDTLLAEKMLIDEKCDAAILLFTLFCVDPTLKNLKGEQVSRLSRMKLTADSRMNTDSRLSSAVIDFSVLLLRACCGQDCFYRILELIPEFNHANASQIRAAESLSWFLKATPSIERDNKLEAVLLQAAVGWCSSEDSSTRGWAVRSLFRLKECPESANTVINRISKSIDEDIMDIKLGILKELEEDNSFEKETLEFLVCKLAADANHVVQVRAQEIQKEQFSSSA